MTTNAISRGGLSIGQRLAIGMTVLALGFGLLGSVGFAGSATIHNAAHDTRHAVGFPCH